MIRYLQNENCEIFINYEYEEDDNKLLKSLFQRCENISVYIDLVSIQKSLFMLLYEYKNKLEIVVYKQKLQTYFYKLGILTNLKQEPFKIEVSKNIDTMFDLLLLDESEMIDFLLEKIKTIYNYNFSTYDRKLIKRRVFVFMEKNEIKELKTAVFVILFDKERFKNFFLEISINVTEFFRENIGSKEFSNSLSNFRHFQNIKIWSAGCSSAEEVYSTAIVLDNLNLLEKSAIYATDFNKAILQEAKNGLYSNNSYKDKYNFDRYINKYETFFEIKEFLKKNIFFFQHNLIEDNSFNEFNVIICKNVLIYFDESVKERIFQLFYDSLMFGGYLILGKSERLHKKFITKFEEKQTNKIYRKIK